MTSDGTTVNMNVGNREYTVNGSPKTMDTKPFIQSDRTYVPLRFAAEAFGEAVSDALSEIINSITYDNFEPQTMYSYYAGTYIACKLGNRRARGSISYGFRREIMTHRRKPEMEPAALMELFPCEARLETPYAEQ